jgi:hypothetical protein
MTADGWVCDDLHLLGENLLSISFCRSVFPTCSTDVMPNFSHRVFVRRIFTGLAELRYRGPTGASTDKNFINILRIDFSIRTETKYNFLVELAEEELNQLVLVDFTVWRILGTPSASRPLN